jgi:Fic family protein
MEELKTNKYWETYKLKNKDKILERSKEYRKNNADKLKEGAKKYWSEKSELIKQKRKELVECEICGAVTTRESMSRHKYSKFHLSKKEEELKSETNI